ELIEAAKKSRLDFICLTDHNTSSHHAELDRLKESDPSLLMIRGEEVTTYGGHANVWGLPANKLIDFRVQPGGNRGVEKGVAEAHRVGALISINHPYAFCDGCSWSFDRTANGFDAMEVWNGEWDQSDERALGWWDQLLQSGRRITAIASSDSHRT